MYKGGLLASLIALQILFMYYHFATNNVTKVMHTAHVTQEKAFFKSAEQSYVIIVSGFRTGSSVFGDLLNSEDDVFFAYEPLHEQDAELVKLSQHTLTEYVSNVTESVLSCDFDQLEESHFQHLSMKAFLGNNKITCGEYPLKSCLDTEYFMEECRKRSTHVIKFVRIPLSHVVHFIEQYANIRLIWMYRDPRAVWNRRIVYDWCTPFICSNSDMLCDQFNTNQALSGELLARYPDQFMMVQFEAMMKNPVMVMRRVTDFLKMKPDTVLERAKSERFGTERHEWVKELPFFERMTIDQKCGRSMLALGYDNIYPQIVS